MYEIKVKTEFSAAHKLRNYQGKCENLHGHNWKVEACVRSEVLNETGMVLDFTKLKSGLKKVITTLDHSYLNNLAYFKKVNPTSENIAKFIFDKLKKAGMPPSKISVWESESSCATYYG